MLLDTRHTQPCSIRIPSHSHPILTPPHPIPILSYPFHTHPYPSLPLFNPPAPPRPSPPLSICSFPHPSTGQAWRLLIWWCTGADGVLHLSMRSVGDASHGQVQPHPDSALIHKQHSGARRNEIQQALLGFFMIQGKGQECRVHSSAGLFCRVTLTGTLRVRKPYRKYGSLQ